MKTPENAPDNNVGRKTPEEIKKILGNPSNYTFGFYSLLNDALAYIQQLESRLAQAERERDAAVADIRLLAEDPDFTICDCCTKSPASFLTGCSKCDFKWRGVCPANTKEEAP